MRRALLALSAVLPLASQAGQAADCRALRERRDALAAEAMRVEITLVQSVRRRLCPQQEALAERANANGMTAAAAAAPAGVGAAPRGVQPGSGPGSLDAGLPPPGEIDYSAYLQCRREAERRLQRSRAVLYTNQQGFSFYTATGARLARQADGLRADLAAACAGHAAAESPR